jgi:hypothetical protein
MRPLQAVARIIAIVDPVLIAPHGDRFHRAPVLLQTHAGPIAWADAAVCRAPAERWVAVDRVFAQALDRQPCGNCWPPDKLDQLTITDAEIPTKEKP